MSTPDSAFIIEAMGGDDDTGLYINEKLICVGSMENLMAHSRKIGRPGDKISFRAIDDESANADHRSGKAPRCDQSAQRDQVPQRIQPAQQQPSKQILEQFSRLNAPDDERIALYVNAKLVMVDSISAVKEHCLKLNPAGNPRIKILRPQDPEHPDNRKG